MNNNNVGTLNEKSIHSFLKDYYKPDKNYQEIKIGNFIADIFYDNTIIEIQTANFSNLQKKLGYYLPLYKVIIVYPISQIKYISWINIENGEYSNPRKSPKNSNIFDSAWELNKISKFLTHKNLEIHLIFLESIEYKLLNGFGKSKKTKAKKYESKPLKIISTTKLNTVENFKEFIPSNLSETFTVKDFSKIIKRNDKRTRQVIYLLEKLSLIERCDKIKNAFVYKIKNKLYN